MTPNDLRDLTAAAVDAAEAGARLARSAAQSPRAPVEHKGAIDLVTRTDRAVEALVRDHLAATGLPILGEEQGGDATPRDWQWIVDPIDGTTNFAHRVPHFAVSIGLWDGTRARAGVIIDVMRGERFVADGEQGTGPNGPLGPLPDPPLADALLASGFAYDRQTNDDDNTREWRAFMKRCRGLRRNGAAALDLAWVAAGRLDGFWEARLQPWDVCAGIALVEVAGGRVTDYDGAPWSFDATGLVAAPTALHAEMLDLVTTSRTRS
jgi:myo-inositol-1(or 4)-monophosphatase